MQKVFLFKIFYDAASRAAIDGDYIPLDNTDGPKDWFELWPILTWLETHEMEEDAWYGFVSPKFPEKAMVSLSAVRALLAANPTAEVALFSYNWPAIATHRNAWVQGELFHPGLIDSFQGFLASEGESVDLATVIGDFDTTVFSNYIIAKKTYWLAWAELARAYFDYVTQGGEDLPDNRQTQHNGLPSYTLRAFVQERLACWVLHRNAFRTIHPNYAQDVSLGRYINSSNSRSLRITLGLAEAVKHVARRQNLPWLMHLYRVVMRVNGATYRIRRALGK